MDTEWLDFSYLWTPVDYHLYCYRILEEFSLRESDVCYIYMESGLPVLEDPPDDIFS